MSFYVVVHTWEGDVSLTIAKTETDAEIDAVAFLMDRIENGYPNWDVEGVLGHIAAKEQAKAIALAKKTMQVNEALDIVFVKDEHRYGESRKLLVDGYARRAAGRMSARGR